MANPLVMVIGGGYYFFDSGKELIRGKVDGFFGSNNPGFEKAGKITFNVLSITASIGLTAYACGWNFTRQGNNLFKVIDPTNRWGFRIDTPHTGHMAKGFINWIERTYVHPHFWRLK